MKSISRASSGLPTRSSFASPLCRHSLRSNARARDGARPWFRTNSCAGPEPPCWGARPDGRLPPPQWARGRPVWLERRKTLELDDLRLTATVRGQNGVVSVAIKTVLLGGAHVKSASLIVAHGGRRYTAALDVIPDPALVRGEIEIPNVDLWWPHTHGEPALYEASLELETTATDGHQTTVKANLGSVGFRTVTLDPPCRRFRPEYQRREDFLPGSDMDAARLRRPQCFRHGVFGRHRPGTRSRNEYAARSRPVRVRDRHVSRSLRLRRHPALAGVHVRQHGLPGGRSELRSQCLPRNRSTATAPARTAVTLRSLRKQRRCATGRDVGCGA